MAVGKSDPGNLAGAKFDKCFGFTQSFDLTVSVCLSMFHLVAICAESFRESRSENGIHCARKSWPTQPRVCEAFWRRSVSQRVPTRVHFSQGF